MRIIQSIDDLDIPPRYKSFILTYLQNISNISFISRVILFGSCAKEAVTKHSDIDIFITANREITPDDEVLLMFDSLPPYSTDDLSIDIIIQREDVFNSHKNSFGMVQKQVNKHGVDLSGLLQ